MADRWEPGEGEHPCQVHSQCARFQTCHIAAILHFNFFTMLICADADQQATLLRSLPRAGRRRTRRGRPANNQQAGPHVSIL